MAQSVRSRTPRASGRLRWAGLVALLSLTGCAKEGIAPTAQDVHQLYTVIMILALPVFIGIEAMKAGKRAGSRWQSSASPSLAMRASSGVCSGPAIVSSGGLASERTWL